MNTKELESKIRELKELQRLIEEAEQEAETIKDGIKAYMGDNEVLTAGEYKVTWKPVRTIRLDSAALKKANPEIYNLFAKPVEMKRFCVS